MPMIYAQHEEFAKGADIVAEYKKGGAPPVPTLNDLIAALRHVFAGNQPINIDCVEYIMRAYKSNPVDWKVYAKFDRYRYTRNLVDVGNGRYNLMALCWGEGHGSAIHDHADAHCFMKMLQGQLQEVRFAWPQHDGQQLVETQRTTLKLNEICYINDSLGLHRVENSSTVDTAVSLHLYCPPYSQCTVFNQSTGQKSVATPTFYSLYGKRNKELNQPEDN